MQSWVGGVVQGKRAMMCSSASGCGKIGYIKRNCRVKLSEANVASENERDQLKWEQCFTVKDIQVRDEKSAPTQVLLSYKNCEEEWIMVVKIGMDDTNVVKLNDVFHVPGEAYVKKTSQTKSVAIWHARLGHLGYQLLKKISSKRLVDGMPSL
ncbi:hypothetical protein V6N12_007630 [Hibiscus sabdariffa]|uniref:GAG-pre-integrase domain-containing protein n=1 Tax=Hibiscus sabdariffa TaxID=183260 RepID=A0ABR2F2D9_9ROSI